MPKDKGKKPAAAAAEKPAASTDHQAKAIDYIEQLRDALTKRSHHCQSLIDMMARFPRVSGSSLHMISLPNLIRDAERTLASAVVYLREIDHMNADELDSLDFMELVNKTVDAALLVFDKRFFDAIQTAAAERTLKPENVTRILKDYRRDIPPEIDRRADADAEVSASASEVVMPSTAIAQIDGQLQALGNPYRPQFSQARAESRFAVTENAYTSSREILGRPVREVGDRIAAGDLNKEMINVGVFFHDHGWVCCNNRGLTCASISGVEPRLEIVFPNTEFRGFYEEKKAGVVGQFDKDGSPAHVKAGKIEAALATAMFSITPEDRASGAQFPPVQVPLRWNPTPPPRMVDAPRVGKADGGDPSTMYRQELHRLKPSLEPNRLPTEVSPADDDALDEPAAPVSTVGSKSTG